MKRLIKQLLFSGLFSICASTTALAGSWTQKEDGWHWKETDGSGPVSAWKWIDGNKDGLAECYYFDENGCLLTNTITPDGCQVDENGAWIDAGILRQRAATPFAAKSLQQEGLKLYQAANENSSLLPGLALQATATMTATYGDFQFPPAVLDLQLKYHDLNTPNMEYWSSASMKFLGSEEKETSFYTGGFYYTDQGPDQKYKMKIGYQDMTSHLTLGGFTGQFGAFLDNLQIAKDQAGNEILLYSSDASDLNSCLSSLCDQMPSLFDRRLEINRLEGRAVINPEGCFLQEDISLFMTMTEKEETVGISTNLHIDYTNPGEPVTITFPSAEGFCELIY